MPVRLPGGGLHHVRGAGGRGGRSTEGGAPAYGSPTAATVTGRLRRGVKPRHPAPDVRSRLRPAPACDRIPYSTITLTATEPTVDPVVKAWGNRAVPARDTAAEATATCRHQGWPVNRPAAATTKPIVGTHEDDPCRRPARRVAQGARQEPGSARHALEPRDPQRRHPSQARDRSHGQPRRPPPAASPFPRPSSSTSLRLLSVVRTTYACVLRTLQLDWGMSSPRGDESIPASRPASRPVLTRERIVAVAVVARRRGGSGCADHAGRRRSPRRRCHVPLPARGEPGRAAGPRAGGDDGGCAQHAAERRLARRTWQRSHATSGPASSAGLTSPCC